MFSFSTVFTEVGNGIKNVSNNNTFFFKSIMFYLPLALFYSSVSEEMPDGPGGIAVLIALVVLFIPYIMASLVFVLTWHRKFLQDQEEPQQFFQPHGLWLFFKKVFWIGLIMMLYMIIPFAVAVGLAFVFPPLGLIGLIGIVVVLYLVAGYYFALPAAAIGVNLKIKKAKEIGKPQRANFVGSSIAAGLLFGILTLLLMGVAVALLPESIMGNQILFALALIPGTVLQLFGIAVNVAILCSYFTKLFPDKASLLAASEQAG